jgi:hypothetical protein
VVASDRHGAPAEYGLLRSGEALLAARCSAGCVVKTDKRPTSTICSVVFPHSDPHRPLQYSLNGLGLAVREILGEVGFRELMQRGAKGGVFHLETR